MKKKQLGMIGCGHMGMSILNGIIDQHLLQPEEILVFDPSEAIQQRCKEIGVLLAQDLHEVAKDSHYVMFAVTPQVIPTVLEELKGTEIECGISIIAATTISYFQNYLGKIPMIRLMPNTPLLVSCGATAICSSEECTDKQKSFVNSIFSSLGIVEEILEEQMDDIIVVQGSTPAYFYYFLNCLLKDAVERGITEEVARPLLVQTMIGSGELLKSQPEQSVESFIDSVCSKGGTTIEAIQVLQEKQLDQIIKQANVACVNRAKELKR